MANKAPRGFSGGRSDALMKNNVPLLRDRRTAPPGHMIPMPKAKADGARAGSHGLVHHGTQTSQHTAPTTGKYVSGIGAVKPPVGFGGK